MFTLLRKIRRSLIDPENTSKQASLPGKYLLYAVGEVLLVMIGILLALSVNNWNEQRKQRNEEKLILGQLLANLEDEIIGYNWWSNYLKPKQDYLSLLSQGAFRDDDLDSFALAINTYYDFKPKNAAYLSLKSSGNLGILQNSELAERIVLFYDLGSEILESWSAWHRNFVNEYIERYILTELRLDKDNMVLNTDNLEADLRSGSLLTLVHYQHKAWSDIRIRVLRSQERAEEIVQDLRAELSRFQ